LIAYNHLLFLQKPFQLEWQGRKKTLKKEEIEKQNDAPHRSKCYVGAPTGALVGAPVGALVVALVLGALVGALV
jgi:hypothetical protein